MTRILAFALGALILSSVAVAPLAHAESSMLETDFNGTVPVTLTSPGQFFTDAAANRYYQGLVYTGQLTGWPVTGTLRIDANIAFEGGSTTGQIDGSYVISDGSGNTFHGDLSESRVQETANGLLIAARLNVEGGTGLFDDAQGSARIAGNLPTLGVSATAFNPAFGQPGFGQPMFGSFPNSPWQINPAQPTLAISGTLALNQTPTLGSWWNQNQDNPFNFQNRDTQQQYRDAVRDFFNVNPNDNNVRPGNGWGDRNHEHMGSQGNSQDESRGNNRGRGRGHKKD
jgi:hypothetical protein